MDFLKRFLKNVLPVNQIIKFIINQFLSSYLIIKENDLEEKPQENSGLKNLINLNDLDLNVSSINEEHLLHSPIKLLKGNLGKFSLDITEENKIIITIEDVFIQLMPLFNYYKKYQKTIFNMEKTIKLVEMESQQENKNLAGIEDGVNTTATNPKTQNTYMLNMANKLLTNLEINIKNVTIKLFTYEISDKIIDNPVFSLFIMKINIYKNEKDIKKQSLIDPNTKQVFEDLFLNNLIIEFDKLCIKVEQKPDLNDKIDKEFKEIKTFYNNNNNKLTKNQEDRILSFFIAYNTIFAMNYKKGPCLTIKLNTKPKIEKYLEDEKEKEKIIEDMNIEINIFEAESIITPHQLFDIKILSQISNFFYVLNQSSQSKEDDEEKNKNEKKENKNENKKENKNGDKDKDKDNNNNDASSSGIFKKNNNNEEENINEDDFDYSFAPKRENKNIQINKIKEKENKKTKTILSHEISNFNITMNAKRIILVILENNNNESIPKLFSFLMEDEIASQCQSNKKSKKANKNVKNFVDFEKSKDSFDNYYCYFDDNILFVKIEEIKSINTDKSSSINISSIITEYIKVNYDINTNQKNSEKEQLNKNKKSSLLQGSIYDSMGGFEEFKEVGSDDEDEFKSAVEQTELLVMENYHNYIKKFIDGEYQSNKFEILIINEIKYNMGDKVIDINEIFINFNYIVILLFIKLFTQIKYFIDTNKPMYTNDDIVEQEDIEDNLNVNLEKKLNDYELQLFQRLNKKSKESNDTIGDGEGDEINSNLDSIEYSEEQKNKEEGMKININYISMKLYNIVKNTQRFDTNIYYYLYFLDTVYPNLSKKKNENIYIPFEQQSLYNIISKDYVEIVLSKMNMIYYNVSNTTKINILFQELLLKYWNYVVIQYNNISEKNDLDDNPNISISLSSSMDILMDFKDKVIINLEKTVLDDLLSFNNKFLYGLSMYQIFNQFCGDLYKNKLINLFDFFGLKNHYLTLNQMNNEEENNNKYMTSNKINKSQKEFQQIKKEIGIKPSIYMGGSIASCVININKNGTFEEKEGNLIKLKLVNLGLTFEMFSDNDNDNTKNKDKEKEKEKEPIYNNLSISINNIFFLLKEYPIPAEGKPKYYNLFSKNKISKCESIDYFNMSFKFRNIKKNREIDVILEEDYDDINDYEEEDELESQKDEELKKKNSKFEVKSSKIILDNKTKEYIAFLLNNQVKLDNMEMVIDVNLSEIVVDSFYHNLNLLSSSLSDFYMDFTNTKQEENSEGGIYVNPSDLIPLCEDRSMIIKCDFNINNLLIDIFLKEDKDQKNWMRLLFICENFKFVFNNEKGMFLILENNYIYCIKDFNYIFHIVDVGDLNKSKTFDIEEKVSDINKEDSYLKKLGYVELFYGDKIELSKTEKELNLNLGNMNVFFCEDSFEFIFDFESVFVDNYLDKIKNIFSHETLNSDDDDNEENDKKIINERKEEIVEKEQKKDEKNKEFVDDFEIMDDVFFAETKDNKQNKKKPKSKYLNNYNTMSTIPEENKKKDFDDFMIIETKTSFERNILRKKKEEECVQYILELQSLRLYFFSGYDFNFQDDTKEDLDLSSKASNENIDNNNDDIFYGNNRNYLLKYKLSQNKINKKILQTKKRIKIEERDYNN